MTIYWHNLICLNKGRTAANFLSQKTPEKQHPQKASFQQNPASNLKSAPTTAITRSICLDSLNSSQPSLSSSATKQVERYIITPILRENKLKPFHLLAQSLPGRISKNDITCLRDLEKTLLYLAPVSNIVPLLTDILI